MTARRLVQAALQARTNAHAPYSGFHVGAALEDAAGAVHTGCNIENATYGLTVCAERVAVWKAMSGGVRMFRRVAVVSDSDAFITPCGACRQILWEFCGNIEVILGNAQGDSRNVMLSALLPDAFDDQAFR